MGNLVLKKKSLLQKAKSESLEHIITVGGKITDEHGNPIADAKIILTTGQRSITKWDGSFLINLPSSLLNKKCHVYVEHDTYIHEYKQIILGSTNPIIMILQPKCVYGKSAVRLLRILSNFGLFKKGMIQAEAHTIAKLQAKGTI